MKSTNFYIKSWQIALRAEIMHLKTYGSTRYLIKNGQLISSEGTYTYLFEPSIQLRIPVGSIIRIEPLQVRGRILSSEGKTIIISVELPIDPLLSELFLVHDPWELLDQLNERLEELKGSKRKRIRVRRLMNPPAECKHPSDQAKSSVHELVLRSKYNPVTFVWGPPGTGKTYTLARTAANKYLKGKKVLILSQSNQAVDVLMAEISKFINKKGQFREGDLLRYGSQSGLVSDSALTTDELIQKRHPDLAGRKLVLLEERKLIKYDLGRSFSVRDSQHLLEIEGKLAGVLEKIRQKELTFVKDADLIGTTLAKAANDPAIFEKEYDIVIIDEASMAYVPQVAFAASLGKRIIVCGDFKQLPPIAASRHPLVDEWLREDIFHKAGVADSIDTQNKLHPQLFLLREQRRMHPDISTFTNRYIYHSLVGDHESVKKARKTIVDTEPFSKRASVLVDSSFTGHHCLREKSSNSRFNLWQLLLSFQLIHESYLAGVRSIGYVTPYRAQASLMEILLSDIYTEEITQAEIISATVHRLQGSERDVIIFDSVDGYPQNNAGLLLAGKDSERLINVAITRTKGKFIHVCDHHFIQTKVYRSKTIRQLVDYQLGVKQGVMPQQIGSWVKNQHKNVIWIHAKKLDYVKKDLLDAKSSIIIGLPNGITLTDEWISILERRQRNVILTMLTDKKIDETEVNDNKTTIAFPFIIIDHQYLWLGQPLEAAAIHSKPPYVAIRLNSQRVVDYFLSQMY